MAAIFFSNSNFIVAIKPAGWLSVPSRLGSDDARPCLGRHLEGELGSRLWPVHRLDQEVTGLILFALSPEAHKKANHWFENRHVVKTYSALTQPSGLLETAPELPRSFRWQARMLRGKKRAYESPHGKDTETAAALNTKLFHQGQELWLWQLRPLTGRPHQLRLDLARHGCPIAGDTLYGSTLPLAGLAEDEIALRCVALDFSACPGATDAGLPNVLTEASSIPQSWLSQGGSFDKPR